jgi:hypothetical protein
VLINVLENVGIVKVEKISEHLKLIR